MEILPSNHYQFSALLTSVASVSLVVLVMRKSISRTLKRQFLLYYAALFLWSLNVFICTSVYDFGTSYLFCQLTHIAAVMIPVFFLHFTYAYLGWSGKRSVRIALFGFYVAASFFVAVIALRPSLFFLRIEPKLSFPYFPTAGLLYTPWMATFALAVLIAHASLLKGVMESKGLRKKQMQFFMIANLLGYSGGIGCFLPVYDLPYFPFPYGPYGVFFLSMISGYVILRHRFVDVHIFVKNTIVFAALFATIISLFSFVLFIFQNILYRFISPNPFLTNAVGVVTLIMIYDPLKKLLMRITDKYLFQKKESIKVILNQLAGNIIMILDISQVADKILATLRESLRLESGAIIIKDEKDKGYEVLESFNVEVAGSRYEVDDIFLKYLGETKKIINLENAEEKNTLPAPILGRLQDFRAVLCIPLFIHNELIGVLTLGKKKSDEEYTSEELDYLPTVASQVSIALSNARLYEILKKSQVDFAQQAKMAAIGTLSAGISHEIKNPLNHMRLAVGMLRLNKRLGVYNNFTKDQFEGEVFNAVERIDANITRATEVIERLSSFAKKPKELKLEAVSLEKALENAFRLLDRELEHYGIAVKKNYAADLPLVSADEHAVEDVFLNLLVNARHAIKEKGTITVGTHLRGRAVEVAIRDTGCGISPENLEKIFDPFFTTKDTTRNPDGESVKGTGLGLFIVRELIKKLGGRIDVESEVGKGTCFRITFPVLQEELAKGA